MSGESWRWIERDASGHPVYCSERIWRHVLAGHPEMDFYEEEVRATIRQPEAVYDDLKGTAGTYNPDAWIVRHIAVGRTYGKHARRLLVVVIRWEPVLIGGPAGYLVTAYTTRRLSGQLELRRGSRP